MPIPDFQAAMSPVLTFLSDTNPHTTGEAREYLAKFFNVSDEEQKEMLPSGRARLFLNRVAWAFSYLKQAGLIESVGRGVYKITPRGLDVPNGRALTVRELMKYPEFKTFREANEPKGQIEVPKGGPQELTPDESLERTVLRMQADLGEELLEKVMSCHPQFFEQVVVDLLLAMGYGGSRSEAGSTTRYTADGGVDGWIKEDKLGLDMIYLQAKRWRDSVGRKVVQEFAGSIEGFRAKKGVLITTSRFTDDAREYVHRIEKRIVLIDGKELSQLMIEHNVGVAEAQRYVVKKIDLDYFVEE